MSLLAEVNTGLVVSGQRSKVVHSIDALLAIATRCQSNAPGFGRVRVSGDRPVPLVLAI